METSITTNTVVSRNKEKHPLHSRSLVIKLASSALNVVRVVSPKLSGQLAVMMMCKTKKKKSFQPTPDFLKGCETFELKIGGRKVQGYSWGKGPKILFFHGWASKSTRWRSYTTKLVDAGYQVLAYDAPGHGLSEGKYLTPFQYINVIESIVSSVGKTHAIVAHSIGAMSLVVALSRRPELSPQKLTILGTFSGIECMFKNISSYLNLPSGIQSACVYWAKTHTGIHVSAFSVVECIQNLSTESTLIIHDQEDPLAPVEQGVAVAQACNNASLFLTRGLGHRLNNHRVVEQVINFVKES